MYFWWLLLVLYFVSIYRNRRSGRRVWGETKWRTTLTKSTRGKGGSATEKTFLSPRNKPSHVGSTGGVSWHGDLHRDDCGYNSNHMVRNKCCMHASTSLCIRISSTSSLVTCSPFFLAFPSPFSRTMNSMGRIDKDSSQILTVIVTVAGVATWLLW